MRKFGIEDGAGILSKLFALRCDLEYFVVGEVLIFRHVPPNQTLCILHEKKATSTSLTLFAHFDVRCRERGHDAILHSAGDGAHCSL